VCKSCKLDCEYYTAHDDYQPDPILALQIVTSLLERQPAAKIVLPELPPTVNHMYGRRGNRTFLKPETEAWFRTNALFVNKGYRKRSPLMGKIGIMVVFYVKTWRKWDIDNRKKGLWDLLTHCGVWGDDSQVDCEVVRRVVDGSIENPETRIFIWELEPAEGLPGKPRRKRATAVRPRREAIPA